MKRNSIILVFLVLALFLFFEHAPVDAFQAEVLPYEISPGEAFIIKLTDANTSQLPTASMNNPAALLRGIEDCHSSLSGIFLCI